MQSSFQCPKCGSVNFVGDAICTQCHEQFHYYCPYCRSPVQGGSAKCPSCNNLLSWPVRQQPSLSAPVEPEVKTVQKKKGSWVWPLIGLIIVVAVACAGVYLFIKMIEPPRAPTIVENTTKEKPVIYVTPDTVAPIITNIQVMNVNYNTVDITWVTNEPATSHVLWRTKDGSYNSTPKKDALLTTHSVELANLTPKSTYYFKVVSLDQFNNESESDEKTFDIGKQPGVAKVEVWLHSMAIDEQPPPVGTRTYIKGIIRNTGDMTLRPRDIEVAITIEIAGRQGSSEVLASLDAYPEEIRPGDSHNFSVIVPNETKPNYNISPRVINQ